MVFRSNKYFSVAFLVFCLISPALQASETSASARATASEILIQRGDEVQVSVLGEPDLLTVQRLDPRGKHPPSPPRLGLSRKPHAKTGGELSGGAFR